MDLTPFGLRRGRFLSIGGPAFLVLEKVYAEEAKQRQKGGQGGVLLKVNLPEANEGQARDKAAKMLNVYEAVSEGVTIGHPLDYLNAERKARTHATKTQTQS